MTHLAARPYLSIVATARNDDHGGNLLARLQVFINALAQQANNHSLDVELVLVEWNPPRDKPPLAEAVRWPSDTSSCRVRILTVPPEIHQRYTHAAALPLYQMIGKNVGIRRAEGEFILATNIDILFSDDLMRFIAERRPQPGRMYRIDRCDVESGVPVDAPVSQQLAYCQTHLLRVNSREGTIALTPDGLPPPLYDPDIISRDSGIYLGFGWHLPEQHFGQLFRAADHEADIRVPAATSPRTLLLELDPALGATSPLLLALLDCAADVRGEVQISGRSIVRIRVPAGESVLRLRDRRVESAVSKRRLSFRAFRCEWDRQLHAEGPPFTAELSPKRHVSRTFQIAKRGARFWADLLRGRKVARVGLPFSARLLERIRQEKSGLSFALTLNSEDHAIPGSTEDLTQTAAPALLHTNACGDFTLAHRRHWMELRGYPEFDLYSMNLDSVFCYMAHYGGALECVLTDPMRIYHIEHGAGSGWTPEGQQLLYRRLAEAGIPWVPWDAVVGWGSQMAHFGTTLIFNPENWGLRDFDFPETQPSSG